MTHNVRLQSLQCAGVLQFILYPKVFLIDCDSTGGVDVMIVTIKGHLLFLLAEESTDKM